MSSRRSDRDSTRGFRDDYRVQPTDGQVREYERLQQAHDRMPPGTGSALARGSDSVDRRRRQYADRRDERAEVERETETARMERRDRTDPDIQRRKSYPTACCALTSS
jgi:hypothetical protein